MTTKQENKLTMYLTVNDYLAANSTLVNALPNFAGYLATFKSEIAQIQTYSELQMFDKKGMVLNKNQLKNNLVLLTMDSSRRMIAFARFSNNQVLLKEIDYNESKLKKCADTILRDLAQSIYDRAQTNLSALSTYGITAATQTVLQAAIANFANSIPKPRLGQVDKKQSTIQLAAHFRLSDLALENIDALVDIMKISQPNFYNGYISVRKILNLGTSRLSLRAHIVDSESGMAIKGVKVLFVLNGINIKSKPIEKMTTEKGGFNIRNMTEGVYTVTLKKIGYADKVVNINVIAGETADLDVRMS